VTHLFGYRNFKTEDEPQPVGLRALARAGTTTPRGAGARFTRLVELTSWWRWPSGFGYDATVAPKVSAARLRGFSGKTGADSPRLPRRPERLATQLARRVGNCPIALMEALRSRNAAMREAAALALGNIGESAHVSADALAQALSDRSERVRLAAAIALSRLGLSPAPLAG
jgi:hypothetical protein